MRTFHDHVTRQTSKRLKTTGMGLGLVRLLQDSGRTEEARTTLVSLENGFQDVVKDKPTRKPCKGSVASGASPMSRTPQLRSNRGGQAGPGLVIFNPAGDTETEAAPRR